MPAQSAYPPGVRTNLMPSIQMTPADHALTASYGNSGVAQQYQQRQRALLRSGNLRQAFMMDALDIRAKFGDKYDRAIAEAAAYMECVERYKHRYGFPNQGPSGGRRR